MKYLSDDAWYELTNNDPYYGPGVDSAFISNDYHDSSRGSKGWPERKADNLTANCEPIV
jgi:hypothetical protein